MLTLLWLSLSICRVVWTSPSALREGSCVRIRCRVEDADYGCDITMMQITMTGYYDADNMTKAEANVNGGTACGWQCKRQSK